jgi:hypothetical protein
VVRESWCFESPTASSRETLAVILKRQTRIRITMDDQQTDTDNELSRKGIPFRDFLDKSTNLTTIFGIFNALLMFSASLDNVDAAGFLTPSFLALSIFVWYELILFALHSNDGSRKYEIYYVLLCSIEIGLLWYFICAFAPLLAFFLLFGIFFLLTYIFTILLTKLLAKTIIKLKLVKVERVSFVIILTSVILSGLVIKISTPLTKPILSKIAHLAQKDSTQIKTK